MKRLTTALLFALLLALLCLPASAAALDEATVETMAAQIVAGLDALSPEIEIDSAGLTRDDYYAHVSEAWQRAFDRSATADTEIVNVSASKMWYSSSGQCYIEPVYFPDAKEKLALLASVMADILAGIDGDWDEVEVLLYLHDRIATDYAYDETHASDSMYTMLETGRGICQGYSDLLAALLDRLGYPNDRAHGPNHVWNLVQLADGAWYHIDVTWGDLIPDRTGSVMHEYFLVSDAVRQLRDGKPYAIQSPRACTSTRFDDALWRQSTSPIVYLDGTWYMFRATDRALLACDFAANTTVETGIILDPWPVWELEGYRYTASCFSGLTAHGDRLYFCTATEIVYYCPATGEADNYHILDTSQGYLYGLVKEDGRLRFIQRTEPNGRDVAVGYVELPTDPVELFRNLAQSKTLPKIMQRLFSVISAQVIAP